VEGRVGILKVHARGKKVSPDVDYNKVARATAGFTGAELMNLMNQSAITTVRLGRNVITEEDIFEALEKIHREKFGRGGSTTQYEEDIVPPLMRRTIAVYEAGRALIGSITPYFDDISKVSVCPGGQPTGYTYFIPQEEHLESRVVTRAYMEAKLVVSMAGRCAEQLVLGEGHVSTAGASDIDSANNIAREMVYRCGFSKRLGPVALMDDEEVYINRDRTRAVANIGTELAQIAMLEVEELLEGAEAKAYYGLASNYKALQALVEQLLEDATLSGDQVQQVLQENGVTPFPDPFVEGFKWDKNGRLLYPGAEESEQDGQPTESEHAPGQNGNGSTPLQWHPRNPYAVRLDLPTDILSKEALY
jgi:cell division protease FtsH